MKEFDSNFNAYIPSLIPSLISMLAKRFHHEGYTHTVKDTLLQGLI